MSPRPVSVGSVGVALGGLAPLSTDWPALAWVVLVGLPGDTIATDSDEARAAALAARPAIAT